MSSTPPERVICYVDGFNLYFGLRDSRLRRYYWLNVRRLAENLLRPHQSLVETKYFTARISGAMRGDPPAKAAFVLPRLTKRDAAHHMFRSHQGTSVSANQENAGHEIRPLM